MTADPEADLLVRFARGDRRAAETLAARLTPRVLAQAYRMLGDRDDAQDVAQETLLRLWQIAGDWRPGEAKVSTWAYRVAGNLCVDRLRRGRGRIDLEAAPEIEDGAPPVDEQMTANARDAALQAALAHLPERQRQAVILRHIEGLANPDIAEIMDISVEAVESLSARGKRALKVALAAKQSALGYEET